MFILACIIPPRLATIKSAHHPLGFTPLLKKKLSSDNIYNSGALAFSFSALSRASLPIPGFKALRLLQAPFHPVSFSLTLTPLSERPYLIE